MQIPVCVGADGSLPTRRQEAYRKALMEKLPTQDRAGSPSMLAPKHVNTTSIRSLTLTSRESSYSPLIRQELIFRHTEGVTCKSTQPVVKMKDALSINTPGIYHFKGRIVDFLPTRIEDWTIAFCRECGER